MIPSPPIALYRPQIPANTRNISRLCVGLQSRLQIVGQPGFSLEDKHLKRAGLDHWKDLELEHFHRFKLFYQKQRGKRIVAFTKIGKAWLWDFRFSPDDVLLFGNEQRGLPPRLLKFLGEKNTVQIPMFGKARSLNLSNAAAIAAYEFLRQMREQGLINSQDAAKLRRTYWKALS